MIATILIVGLAFYWLLLETRWLTANLRYTLEQAVELERKAWEEIESDIKHLPNKYQPFWLKYPANMQPLCGMEWLESTAHVIPDIKVELYFGNGYRQTFRLKKPDLMKQIIKINTGKKYFGSLAVV